MYDFILLPQPAQSLTAEINDTRWEIRIKQTKNSVIADVEKDDEPVIMGVRIVGNTFIVPYPYLHADGSFAIIVDDENVIDYTLFGETQNLVFFEPDEVKEIEDAASSRNNTEY